MSESQGLMQRNLNRILALLLLIMTVSVYWQVQDLDFINFDDPSYVTGNDHVQKGLTKESLIWAFTATYPDYWHPLTWVSQMLDSQLYGLNPTGYHLTNLLFHIGNTLLLFLVLNRITQATFRSAFVAALFALHPLHVESVAWVAERKDVLSTFFWMLTLWAYAYYTDQPGLKRYWLVISFFFLGLMAKPMLITLPFVLLLLDYWPFRRFQVEDFKGAGRLILEKIPLIGLSLISVYITVFLRQGVNIIISTESVPMDLRIGNALVSYMGYIEKMIWPSDLSVFYPYPKDLPMVKIWGAGLFLLCISLCVIRGLRRYPYLLVGWLWYLGTLMPIIGLVQWGLWPAMADRFTYVPLIGLFLMVSWLNPDLMAEKPFRKTGLTLLACMVLLTLMVSTWFQVRHWQTTETLFKHALRVTRDNYAAHFILARDAGEKGEMEKALYHYNKALAINPGYVALMHNRVGYQLAEHGELNEAINQFKEAIRIHPLYANAYNNLGVILARKGRIEEAVAQFSKALDIFPGFNEARKNLENVLRQKQMESG